MVNSINSPSAIYQNKTEPKNYISVKLKGENFNEMVLAQKFVIYKSKIQLQQLMFTRGFQSASDIGLHFWPKVLEKIDSLLVVWPNQKMQIFKNISANQQFIIDQKNAKQLFVYEKYFDQIKDIFKRKM